MGMQFRHEGGALPIRLDLDETETTHACPTCERAGLDGTVTIKAALERQSGMTPAKCTRGHLVMVQWHREPSSSD